jgi:hypothetical protein
MGINSGNFKKRFARMELMAYICKRKLNIITMRKITEQVATAFNSGTKLSVGNTKVVVNGSVIKMYLHSNLIATKNVNDGSLIVTSAGWKTATTKDRLNAISNVHVQQKRGEWFLNGEEWGGEEKLIK